jgi:imidazolonepropionase-like amidohydrolase
MTAALPTVQDLVVRDAALLDATGAEPSGRVDVVVRAGRIDSIAKSGSLPVDGRLAEVDGAGCTLMPGLTDAHVHLALIGPNGDHGDDPWVIHVLRVAARLSEALDEGFTTIRDAGGLEPVWRRAVDEGYGRGPRILSSGSVLSQTGGHGDLRRPHQQHTPQSIPGLVAHHAVVDGPDEVRRMTREQLRRGATQVKLLTSGGIVSPTDPFDSLQFSVDEIRAAVEAAADFDTYVHAHCHTTPAIERAIDAGVRCIEHASILEPATAKRMADAGVAMVPTLQALDMLANYPERWSLNEEKVARLRSVSQSASESVVIARDAGVRIGSGSDVVGPWQGRRGEEIVIKAGLLGAHDAIISATRTNAEIFGLEKEIGTVEKGKLADLVLVDGEPLTDVSVLADPTRIVAVIKAGEVVKDSGGRLASSS